MYKNKKVWGIVLAAGNGTRIGFDKMLYKIDGTSVRAKSMACFENHPYVDEIIVAAGKNYDEICGIAKSFKKVTAVVKGGETRAVSVINRVNALPEEDGIIAVHDGARPFVSRQVITDAVEGCLETGAAVPCVKVKDTIKNSDGAYINKTFDRSKLFITQTPQVFDLKLYRRVAQDYFDKNITDDAQLFERRGIKVKITAGDYENYKITTVDDIKENMNMRIGHGYDVHKLVENRDLIMGGVKIPYEKGLLGHSDADVVLHAVMDSLLGALALGDIGKHFPDTDEKYKGADSLELTRQVGKIIAAAGATVENVDVTIICQKPKLAPYIDQMRENIAGALYCAVDRISVKATTEEHLGFTGEGLGISCYSVCLLNIH